MGRRNTHHRIRWRWKISIIEIYLSFQKTVHHRQVQFFHLAFLVYFKFRGLFDMKYTQYVYNCSLLYFHEMASDKSWDFRIFLKKNLVQWNSFTMSVKIHSLSGYYPTLTKHMFTYSNFQKIKGNKINLIFRSKSLL